MTTLSVSEPSAKPTRTDPLLRPFALKHLTLRNRIMSTSHACGLEDGGLALERYQAYHLAKAKGGIGLSMFGGSSNVSPDSPSVFQQLYVGDDRCIAPFQRFSERMHAEGAALMCQITHLGRRGDAYAGNLLPTISPSATRETQHRSFAKEMDEHDIARVVKHYADAAWCCKEGGLDGIETLGGGHMMGQFLSPAMNQRTDRYGGSLENRCRFPLEVYEAIRKRVGDRLLVGFRFAVDEGDPDGLGFEESCEIARVLERSGLIDFWNAIYGRMDRAVNLSLDNMPGMESPLSPWLQKAAAFKREMTLPVFHAARITDLATARYAIENGLVDMVGMTRAHIADPQTVNKLARGEVERIRPCVGAQYCRGPTRPSCLHNPASGRELTLPQVIERADKPGRRAVVVGAGPAGLEAARVLCARGHHVTVLEAASRPGGQVRLAAEGSWRRDLVGIIDWRVSEIETLGGELRLNVFAEPDDIHAMQPDIVIVATGGMPDLAWLKGGEHASSAWGVIDGSEKIADEVLIYDGTGRHTALIAAEKVMAAGKSARIFTLDDHLGMDLHGAEQTFWKRRTHQIGLPLVFDQRLVGVTRRGNRLVAHFINELTDETREEEVDQILVENGTMPVAELWQGLRAGARNDGSTDLDALVAGKPQPAMAGREGFELHRIGDAVSSRNVFAAIHDALRLCHVM
ncbi:MAG: NADH:flavin oxidoreductase [Hyphomicrobiaceae bacterium]